MSATSMWHHLHDQHRVRRRAPGIYLPRVTAEAKRATIREMPVEWLINTLALFYRWDEREVSQRLIFASSIDQT